MPINQEGQYEDSYQKGERLREELKLALEELRSFNYLADNDQKNLEDLQLKIESIDAKLEELNELEKDLKSELEKLESEEEALIDIDEKIDAAQKTSEQQSKIWNLYVQEDDLYKELYKIYEEQAGRMGDAEGTMVIIKMKIEKIESIKKELRELEN